MGVLYLEMGDSDEAEPLLLNARSLARDLKNKPFEEATLIALMLLEHNRRNYSSAIKYAEQGAALDLEVNNLALRFELLTDTALIYQELNENQKALVFLRRALEFEHASGNKFDEAIIISTIGTSQKALGSLPEALDSMTRARALLHQTGSFPIHELNIEWGLGGIQRALGHNDDALSSYRQAVSIIEQLRTSAVATETSKASVIGSRRDVFVDTVDLLASLKREAEALEMAERYHARAFLDQLAQSRIDVREDMTKAQREREDNLLAHLATIQKEILRENVSAERESQMKTELTAAENDLEVFQAELRRANPRYASVKYPELLSVERIQRDLLESDTSLVEYILGEKRSFAWAVSQNNLVMAVLPPRKEIEDQVAAYRSTLAQKASALTLRQSLAESDRQGQKLYAMLLQPLENSLSSSRRLTIVPDGVLSYLPFEALRIAQSPPLSGNQLRGRQTTDGDRRGQYLLSRFSIAYAPSASALAAIKNRNQEATTRPKMLLAFGDPVYDIKAPPMTGRSALQTLPPPAQNFNAGGSFNFTSLPYTRAEVDAISALYPKEQRQVYLGAQAREETVKAERLDQYRYIHFAAHGLINEAVPSRSGIVLSLSGDAKDDGVLQMREIVRLKLNADLVTLSACSTGLGKLVDGEGMIGLTRAFIYAGANSVVVSLWNVNDGATAELMKIFYRNLNHGIPKDEALREAKLTLINGSQRLWGHPYFWAPFVLLGNRNAFSKVTLDVP
jgi:CHAT domain-containing protein